MSKNKELNIVLVKNEIAMDYATYYVDGFIINFAPTGVFKVKGYADHVERPPEERYVNGIQEKNGPSPIYVDRVESFEIIVSPNLAISLYNLLGNELQKHGISLALPKSETQKQDKEIEITQVEIKKTDDNMIR